MGLSQAWILKTFSKPHKWAKKIKHDSANPGVNAWASGKGRTIVFDINQPTREFLKTRWIFSSLLEFSLQAVTQKHKPNSELTNYPKESIYSESGWLRSSLLLLKELHLSLVLFRCFFGLERAEVAALPRLGILFT